MTTTDKQPFTLVVVTGDQRPSSTRMLADQSPSAS